MIQFDFDGSTLRLLRDGRCVYSIHPGVELLRAGYGKNDYSMTRVSFTIK